MGLSLQELIMLVPVGMQMETTLRGHVKKSYNKVSDTLSGDVFSRTEKARSCSIFCKLVVFIRPSLCGIANGEVRISKLLW